MGLTAIADETVPVLIVGGGGAGMTASMLLARQGIPHLVVSPPGNVRPVAQRISRAAAPPQPLSDEALADAGRVILAITVDRVGATNCIPAPVGAAPD